MKKIIYYFTGTGNSMRAAKVIAARLGDTDIISMRCDPNEVSAIDADIVGFVFPVYHWTMPAPAVSFVRNLAINPKAYVFVIAMPSFICGIACEKAAALLAKKGISISYGNMVKSVANYVIVYPPFPSPKFRVPRTEKKLKRIAEDIKNKKTRPYPLASRFIKQRRKRFMTPYLDLQKYADMPFTISEACISCGLCTKVCPCANIELKDGKPVFLHHCAQCMACVTSCPHRAIGYDITAYDQKMLNACSKKTPLVRIMGLPKRRKMYRNPYIKVQELTEERMRIN